MAEVLVWRRDDPEGANWDEVRKAMAERNAPTFEAHYICEWGGAAVARGCPGAIPAGAIYATSVLMLEKPAPSLIELRVTPSSCLPCMGGGDGSR